MCRHDDGLLLWRAGGRVWVCLCGLVIFWRHESGFNWGKTAVQSGNRHGWAKADNPNAISRYDPIAPTRAHPTTAV